MCACANGTCQLSYLLEIFAIEINNVMLKEMHISINRCSYERIWCVKKEVFAERYLLIVQVAE